MFAARSSREQQQRPPPSPRRRRPNESTYWVNDSLLAGEHPMASSRRSSSRGDGDDYGETKRRRVRSYLDCGISCFVDLTYPGEREDYEEILREEASARKNKMASTELPGAADDDGNDRIVYRRIPVPDFGVPESKESMKRILDTIDDAITRKHQNVYVHCRGGIGRTGTVVGCYLVRHRGGGGSEDANKSNNKEYSGKDALEEVNRLFQSSARSRESSYSPETSEQMRFVEEWEE